MPDCSIWCYAWDLADEGIEAVVAGLKKDVGLNAINVATSYHSVAHLRSGLVEPKWFNADGAVYFQPEPARYEHTPIKPIVSPWLAERDPLREIDVACREHAVALRSWTVCFHNSALGRAFPDAAIHDCFGSPHEQALCPAHPQARDYVKALVADLAANYGFDAVELEACHWAPRHHWHRHEKIGVPFGDVERLCLALCFNPATKAAAAERNIDADGLQHATAAYLREVLYDGRAGKAPLEAFIERTPGLAEYIELRKEVATSLIGEIREACPVRLNFYADDPGASGAFDLAAIAPLVDEVTVLCYFDDPARTEAALVPVIDVVGAERVRAGLQAYWPASPDGETLVANTLAASLLGVRRFAFYHYGIMPRANLAWVADAIAALA